MLFGFFIGSLVGATAMLFALALCQAAGRCPYQDDDGSCVKEKGDKSIEGDGYVDNN
jgi:hypothetical protein